jgi:penicillin-binding protein A
MKTQLNKLALGFAVVFILLFANLTYLQVFDATSLNNRADNKRSLFKQYDIDRGSIIVSGQPVAYSVKTTGRFKYERRYVSPAFTHPVGYLSSIYGAAGVEQDQNPLLSGAADSLAVDRFRQLLDGGARRGGSVSLTLDAAAQQLAYQLLANRKGAIVAIEPRTGKILVSASSPSFDANLLATTNAQTMQESWNKLVADKTKPLQNRAYTETWAPGSIFKLVVAAAALESGRYTETTKIPAPATYKLAGSTKSISNWQNAPCSPSGEVTLLEAIAVSCNTAFARLGVELGSKEIAKTAAAFGFGSNFNFATNTVRSVVPETSDPAQNALIGIGQFDVRATVLQLALVAAAIGNEGVLMQPIMIDQVFAPNLTVLRTSDSNVLNRAIKPTTAAALTRMMQAVVSQGTGSNARISNISVAGKTGTAETRPGASPHAWFVAFAPAQSPKIAIAVLIEGGAAGGSAVSGNALAAPIAQRLLVELLGRK